MRIELLIASVVFAGMPAAAALAQQDPPVDCAKAMTQMDMNYCADQDFQKADKELNQVYKQAVKSAEQIDKDVADMGPNYVGAVKALKKAQRAWIDYRDGHCEGVGFEARGGSMEPMVVSGCKAGLTNNRIRELHDLIKGSGN